MKQGDVWAGVELAVGRYVASAKRELGSRWAQWPRTYAEREKFEVLAALAARQTTLSIHLALSPYLWNRHTGTLIFRAMVDVRINVAWILMDPIDRSRKFIAYGLGQEKLHLENQKERARSEGEDPEHDDELKAWEDWLNTQRFTFLTEVNVGSWSGLDTRKMAEEAGLLDYYKDFYAPLSGPTHSMWQHLVKYNLATCHNPLHGFHRVPVAPLAQPDLNYPLGAAQILEETWESIDAYLPVAERPESAYELLMSQLDEFGSSLTTDDTADETPTGNPDLEPSGGEE